MTDPTASNAPSVIGWEAAAASALALVDLTAIASLGRVFDDSTANDARMRAMLCLVAAVHLIQFVLRRWRIPTAAMATVTVVVSTLATTRWFFSDTTWFGIPTPSSASTFQSSLSDAIDPIRRAIAPVPLQTGLAAAITLGAGLLATYSAIWAFRLKAPGAALVAPLGVFMFSSIAAQGLDVGPAVVSVLGSAALFWVAQRSFRLARVGGTSAVSRRVVQSTFLLGLAVSLIALGLGGSLTRAAAVGSEDAVIDLRSIGRAPEPRVVSSPLVRVGSLLRSGDDTALFTARSERPHYWRLTSLDRFDGDAWTSSARYRPLPEGETTDPPFATDEEPVGVGVRLGPFETDWIPAPFAPVRADGDVPLRIDESSSSLFVDDAGLDLEGRSVEVTAVAPPPDGTATGGGVPALSTDDTALLLALPARTAATIGDVVGEVVGDSSDPLETARRIQDYFRSPENFRYDLGADYSDSDEPIRDFLESGAGFCQQFASTFAAFARQAGLPARVAVGFTYGIPLSDDPGSWVVESRHAHAWPEVYIDDVGWLPFEPTPSRGNPDATGYTGVAAEQDGGAPPVDSTTSTTPSPTSVVPATSVAGTPTSTPGGTVPPDPVEDPSASPETSGGRSLLATVLLAGLAVFAAVIAGRRSWVVWRARRERSPARGADLVIADLYADAVDQLSRIGVASTPTDTPLRVGALAAEVIDVPEVSVLARLESDRRYAPGSPTADDLDVALGASDAIDSAVVERLGPVGRFRRYLDV